MMTPLVLRVADEPLDSHNWSPRTETASDDVHSSTSKDENHSNHSEEAEQEAVENSHGDEDKPRKRNGGSLLRMTMMETKYSSTQGSYGN